MLVVPSMKVTLVHVVDVVPMRDRDMTGSVAVDVVMIDVFLLAVLAIVSRRRPDQISTRKSLARRGFSPAGQACAPLFERLASLARARAVLRLSAHEPRQTDASAV